MSRALVIGASGFIGQTLVRQLGSMSRHQVSGTYHARAVQSENCARYYADLTDAQSMTEVFQEANPEIVVLLAAMADVLGCENEPERATKVNLIGTEIVTTLCEHYDARLVYLSTEYVFNGERGNYREDETPEPTTHYGVTKWEAEKAVARSSKSWAVIRTSLVYGWPPTADRANLVTRVIDNLSRGNPAYGHTDQYRSPVYVEDLAQGIIRVMEEDYSGVSHIAGPDWIHMGQFVSSVAEAFHLDGSLVVQSQLSQQGTGGPRPSLLGLNSTQSVARLGFQPRDVVSGLMDMQTNRRVTP